MPVFKLRASEEEEILGIDDVEIGEFAVSSMLHSAFQKSEELSADHDTHSTITLNFPEM
jgi:hypothetical protein